MKKLIKNVLTNRLGLIFAIANLLLITLNRSGIGKFFGFANFDVLAFLLNLPARIASIIFYESLFSPAAQHSHKLDLNYYSFGTLLFVVLQWLFIGWLWTVIADTIRKLNR